MHRFALLLPLAVALLGCVALPTGYPRTESQALTDTRDTALGRMAARFADAQRDPALSGVTPLAGGRDAFVARLALAEAAERSLDVQYYIWHPDTTGQLLAAALLRAADRGVRVRLILDDIGSAPDDANLLALDAHPAIEVRLFNPVALRGARMLGFALDFERSNRRMHNKSFTADNQATIVGGRNIGDEYFEARTDVSFADLDALVTGPAVADVSASFDRYWNSEAVFPIGALAQRGDAAPALDAARSALRAAQAGMQSGSYANALRDSPLAQQLRRGRLDLTPARVQVLADDPSKAEQPDADRATLLLARMTPLFDSLRSELTIVSPYFVPGEGGTAGLQRLRAQGTRVRVVTNSLAATDVPAVHSGYARYRQPLLAAGVELYEIKASAAGRFAAADAAGDATTAAPERHAGGSSLTGSSRASLHAKTIVFDCERVFVGSMNLDPRSVFINTEIGILIESPTLAARMCEGLTQELPANAYRLELQPEPGGDAQIAWVENSGGVEHRHASEPAASRWRRFQAWFMSLLPIEPLL